LPRRRTADGVAEHDVFTDREGAEKDRIAKLAAQRGLQNIKFLDQQPRERIAAYVSAADLCLVMLRRANCLDCDSHQIAGIHGVRAARDCRGRRQARQIVELPTLAFRRTGEQ